MKFIDKHIKHKLGYLIFKALSICTIIIPRYIGIRLFGSLAVLVSLTLERERRRAKDSLTFMFSESKSSSEIIAIQRAMFYNLGITIFDAIKLPSLSPQKFKRYFDGVDRALFDSELSKGKGVIGLTGHLSGFELLSQIIAVNDYPVFTVGAELFDESLDDLVKELRTRNGVGYVHRDRAMRSILKLLKKNYIFGVLVDHDTTTDGVFAPFLGEIAFTPSTMIKVAVKTEIPIVFAGIYRDSKYKYHFVCSSPIEVLDYDNIEKSTVKIAKEFNDFYSKLILDHPEQWLWMHRRWRRKRVDFPHLPSYDEVFNDN